MRLEVGKERGEIPCPCDYGARGGAEIDAEFFGDDLAKRGFAQTRWVQKATYDQGLARAASQPG